MAYAPVEACNFSTIGDDQSTHSTKAPSGTYLPAGSTGNASVTFPCAGTIFPFVHGVDFHVPSGVHSISIGKYTAVL